jgi:hypothetical protein
MAVNYGAIYTSVNSGSSWNQGIGPSKGWTGLACSSDGSRWVVGSWEGVVYSSPLAARVATAIGTGGSLTGEPNASVELQYIGGGLFRALSGIGVMTPY